MYDLLSWLLECSGVWNLVRLDSCKAVFQKKVNVTPRRVLSAPGSRDCSPRAKNSRHLAPPPKVAGLGRLSSSSAVRGGGDRGSGKRNQGRGGRQREGRGLRAAPLLPPLPRPATLGTLCSTQLSSLVLRFRGTYTYQF